MITSGHYLHPDYLQPLPTTLDAKQSPLALLAQTCNSIGKDTSSKSIIPPLEKKDSSKDRDSTKGSPAPKSEDKNGGRVSADKREVTPTPKQRDADDRKASSNHQSPSPGEPRTHSGHSKPHSSPASPSRTGGDRDSRNGPSPVHKSSTPSLSLQSNSKISLNCGSGSVSVEVKHQDSISASSVSKSSPPISSAQPSYADTMIAHGTPLHSLPGSYHGLSLLGHMGHGAVDAASAAAAYYASLPPAHGGYGLTSAQKGAGLPPYLQYTSVKTASGTTLVPVCKDPYCGQCQATVRSTHVGSSCSPGCTQCTSEKCHSLTGGLHAPTPLGAGISPAATHQSLLSSLYPHHAFSVLPGQHTMPYVCNWLQGSDYCGKRFGTSEELLLHLRSHTSIANFGDAASLPSALPYANLGLTTAAAAAGLHFHYPTQGSLSPNSLRHAYPRSLSPTGLSALAASRYHPYKSPLSSLTASQHAALPAGLPSHLSPYYLPYSLYGQRLSAAMTP